MSRAAAAAVLAVGAAAFVGAAWYAQQRALEAAELDAGAWGLDLPAMPDPAQYVVALEDELAPFAYGALGYLEQFLPGLAPAAEELHAMTAEQNLTAFLALIRIAETGTAGDRAYSTIFGGGQLATFADHPRKAVTAMLGGRPITSTAAGAYQFLSRTWDEAARALGLRDFSPANQDIAATWLIRRRGALADVRAGRIEAALAKCAKEWASLPGSPYGQPTKTIGQALALYESAGGSLA